MSKKIKIKKPLRKLERPYQLNILNHIADFHGCGSVRIIFPSIIMSQLPHKDVNVTSLYTNRFSYHPETYKGISHAVFQRITNKTHLEVIKYMKTNIPNVPLIYEVDDNLMNIPEWNFAHKYFNDQKPTIIDIMKNMTGITVSTHYLRKELLKYNKNIKVIENHLPKYLWGNAICNAKETTKARILYAGSANHFERNGGRGDFSQELIEFVKKTTDIYEWVFVGSVPHELKHENIEIHEWIPFIQFPMFLRSLKCDLSLAPLDFNNFNKSKSNIKALEAVALGIPLISTHIEPYKNLSLTSKSPHEMISDIEYMAGSADQRKYRWKDQYNTLKDQLFWEDNDFSNCFDYIDKMLRLIGYKL